MQLGKKRKMISEMKEAITQQLSELNEIKQEVCDASNTALTDVDNAKKELIAKVQKEAEKIKSQINGYKNETLQTITADCTKSGEYLESLKSKENILTEMITTKDDKVILKHFTAAMTEDESLFIPSSKTSYETVEFMQGQEFFLGQVVLNQEQYIHSSIDREGAYKDNTKPQYEDPTTKRYYFSDHEECFLKLAGLWPTSDFNRNAGKESTNQNTRPDSDKQNDFPLKTTGHAKKHAKKCFLFLCFLWITFIYLTQRNYFVQICATFLLLVLVLLSISKMISPTHTLGLLKISFNGEDGKYFIEMCRSLSVSFCIVVGYWDSPTPFEGIVASLLLLSLLIVGLGVLLYAYRSYTNSYVWTLRETLISLWGMVWLRYLLTSVLFWVMITYITITPSVDKSEL